MTNISSGSSIQFIPANCPVCGGELRVPSNIESVKCMYCGRDILIRNKNHLIIETKQNTDRLLDLAQSAEESRNYEQSYQYYSQVLEQDSNIAKAWIGKGISAGYMSSLKSQKISEAITCIKKGIQLDSGLNKYAAVHLAHVILMYTKGLNKYFTNRLHEEMRPPGVILDPVMSGFVVASRRSTSKETMAEEFRKNHSPFILQGLIFSWQISKDIGVAKKIIKTLNEVSSFDVLPKGIIGFMERKLATVLSEIKEKFPEISPQKNKAKNNKTPLLVGVAVLVVFCFVLVVSFGISNSAVATIFSRPTSTHTPIPTREMTPTPIATATPVLYSGSPRNFTLDRTDLPSYLKFDATSSGPLNNVGGGSAYYASYQNESYLLDNVVSGEAAWVVFYSYVMDNESLAKNVYKEMPNIIRLSISEMANEFGTQPIIIDGKQNIRVAAIDEASFLRGSVDGLLLMQTASITMRAKNLVVTVIVVGVGNPDPIIKQAELYANWLIDKISVVVR